MPSRRKLLERVGGVAVAGSLVGGAAHLDVGVVRTKLGGNFGGDFDLESPDSDQFTLMDDAQFVPPDEFSSYVDRTRDEYGDAALPWTDPESLPGEFVGTYARQVDVIPDRRFAYEVDPWGVYREDPAFTWLTHEVETDRDDQLSTDRTLLTDGGPMTVADATVTVPDGEYRIGVEDDVRYRTRWDGFHRGEIPLVGACEVSFAEGEKHALDWTLSNGVGIRTPF